MKNFNAIIFGTAIIIASFLLGKSYVTSKKKEHKISVTGLGSQDFESDLIVWTGSYNVFNRTSLQEGYRQIKGQKSKVINYLTEKGINKNEIVFETIETSKREKSVYNENGRYVGSEFLGYYLTQTVKVESKEINKVEKLSREITDLISQGVDFNSNAPRYYYTKLSDLKIEMIKKASEDATLRAKTIAENSGGKLGKLIDARMGIFQITGRNSSEEYSWGGTFNTSSRKKTANITVKLNFEAN